MSFGEKFRVTKRSSEVASWTPSLTTSAEVKTARPGFVRLARPGRKR